MHTLVAVYKEIAERLELIIRSFLPFLPPEEQRNIDEAIYNAKQFNKEQIEQLTDRQMQTLSQTVEPCAALSESPKVAPLATISEFQQQVQDYQEQTAPGQEQQSSLINMLLYQLVMMNANSNNSESTDQPEENFKPATVQMRQQAAPKASRRGQTTSRRKVPLKKDKPTMSGQRSPSFLSSRFMTSSMAQIGDQSTVHSGLHPYMSNSQPALRQTSMLEYLNKRKVPKLEK